MSERTTNLALASREERTTRLKAEYPELVAMVNGERLTLDKTAYAARIAEMAEAEEAREADQATLAQRQQERAALISALEAGTATPAQMQGALLLLLREGMPARVEVAAPVRGATL